MSSIRQTAPTGGGPQAAKFPAGGQGARALGGFSSGTAPAGGDSERCGLGCHAAGATPGAATRNGDTEEQVNSRNCAQHSVLSVLLFHSLNCIHLIQFNSK